MHFWNRVLSLGVLFAASVCGALVGSPLGASALTFTVTEDQSACVQRDSVSLRDFSFGLYNPSTTSTANVDCAWDENWATPAVTASQVTIYGYDGSSSSETQVRACAHDYASTSWYCDTVGHSGVSYLGTFSGTTFHPGLYYWQNSPYSTYFHTLTVNLGTDVSSGVQEFWGYTAYGTFTVPTS